MIYGEKKCLRQTHYLLPIMKLYIPSFEQKMTVKDILNFFKLLLQTLWVDCFQFWNPKVSCFFRSGCNWLAFVIFSIRVNFTTC